MADAYEALCEAVKGNDVARVRALLPTVKRVDRPDGYLRRNLLQLAVSRGRKLDIIKLLVERGLDPKHADREGTSALSIAVDDDRAEILEVFEAAGFKVTRFAKLPQAEKTKRLWALVVNDWSDDKFAARFTRMVKAGADPNAKDRNGDTPLLYLTGHIGTSGQKELAAMIACGAAPKVVDTKGNTALHRFAAMGADPKVVQVLLGHLPIDAPNREGQTPLHVAAASRYNGATELTAWLLKKGADPKRRDRAGRTALDVASPYGNPSSAEVIARKVMPPISSATRALLSAICTNDLAGVTRALAKGADPSVADAHDEWNNREGVAAVHLCLARDVDDVIADAVFGHRGVDPSAAAVDGATPLHTAIRYLSGERRMRRVEALLAAGADPNRPDRRGEPPLFQVISLMNNRGDGECEIVDRLVAAGAKVGYVTPDNKSVLDAALYLCVDERHFSYDDDVKYVAASVGLARVLRHLVALGAKPKHEPKKFAAWLARTKVPAAKPAKAKR